MKLPLKISSIRGFTLVELLVVLGLFSSIATLALGALFNAQSVNARLQETQAILDNINLSSQTITRDIRFGSDFYCAQSLPIPALVPTVRKNCIFGTPPGTVLIFKASDAEGDLDRVAYYVSNGVLYKNVYQYLATTTVLQMTSDDVNITSITFNVSGAQTSTGSNDDANEVDYQQPLIKMLISGVTRPAKASTPPASFDLETVVSAREIDNQ
jgi:prepilin-type N-terminal cleavage/methylation domain-containing protein